MIRMLNAHVPSAEAAILSNDDFGSIFSKIGKGVKAVGKGAVKYTIKPAVKATLAPAVFVKDVATGKNVLKSTGKMVKSTAAPVLVPGKAIGTLALKPLINHVNTLKSRRAKKLAWDRRRSKTPTAQENNEARGWAKRKLIAKGPHGRLIALLAGGGAPAEDGVLLGADDIALLGNYQLGIEPATITAITASLPLLVAMVKGITAATAKSGEAPPDPTQVAAQTVAALAPEGSTTQRVAQAFTPPEQVEAIQSQEAQQVPVDQGVETPVEPAAYEMTTDPGMQGYYFGAAPSTAKTVGFVAGLLGLVAVGAYAATR
jgi:hypothetical protein